MRHHIVKVVQSWGLLLNLKVQTLHLHNTPINQPCHIFKSLSKTVVSNECRHLLKFLSYAVNAHDHLHKEPFVNTFVLRGLCKRLLVSPVVNHLVELEVEPFLDRIFLPGDPFEYFHLHQFLSLAVNKVNSFGKPITIFFRAVLSTFASFLSSIEH